MKSAKIKIYAAVLVALAAQLLFVYGARAQDPSEGLVPTVRVLVPNLSPSNYKAMPPSFTVGVLGADADAPSGRPVKYRYLLTSAQYDTTAQGDPRYIKTPLEYSQHGAELLSWDDPNWSTWLDYPADGLYPTVSMVFLADDVYYLMAFQVMDADGAVSTALDYQYEVFNLKVLAGYFRPAVALYEPYLGATTATSSFTDIASGQPLNFSWSADADAYGGQIVSYRHGWDLVDPNDPNDPGWEVPPGLLPENLFAVQRTFQEGIHTFYLRVVDDSQQVTQMTWQLRVIPYVDRMFQFELLLIDQTVDSQSNRWPDQGGIPRDQEAFRNAYWEFLADGAGGVANFDWERDRLNHTEQVHYADLVKYKAVLCYARSNVAQTMFQEFRPVGGQDKYVWLAPYQYRGGNYFQVGEKSMDSFLEMLPNYMIPVIFDATETSLVIGGDTYVLGFGQKDLPDGTTVPRGPTMYPYATAGIAALDWTSPSTKYIYPRTVTAKFDRHVDCVGLKGLVLDADFRTNHAIVGGAIADTFFTDQVIDWPDAVAAGGGTLDLFSDTFPFRDDEFVDYNISSRPTPILPQECLGAPEAPGGMCVEPMFKGISRLDWMREYKRAGGDPGWPQSQYTDSELDNGCGTLGLTSYQGIPRSGARTNGATFGYLSYRMIEDKPLRRADVYWGFDPYRFDQNETKKAIRWVLDYFGLIITP